MAKCLGRIQSPAGLLIVLVLLILLLLLLLLLRKSLCLKAHVVDLFSLMAKSGKQLLSRLLISTKPAESNAILVLLSATDTESHALASIQSLSRINLNLLIASMPIARTLAKFRILQRSLFR
jgi:hypothetical protein